MTPDASRVPGTARRGFQQGAAAYRRWRPSYPTAALDLLARELTLVPGRTVLDVGAGTGIFTTLLLERGAEVVAVEPVPAMRDELRRGVPGVPVVAAAAEELPLADGVFDAVTVAQAFHWFRADAALGEMRRVLRPGGRLALVWNVRDRTVGWVDDMARYIEERVGELPYEGHHHDDQRQALASLAAAAGFGPLGAETFAYDQPADLETLVGRAASTSYVASLPEERRAELLDGLGSLLAGHPGLAGRQRFTFPHITRVYWCALEA